VPNGAERLVETAVANGVDVCFTNPGTTEMPLVAALDAVPGIRGVLGLFEGVVTGAADGYGRIAGTPALTLLHLGAGLGNGIANLHNARRARSPIVNLVGDHATWHVAADSPLTSDIVSLASPVSGWVGTVASPGAMAADSAAAIEAALQSPGQIATLIVPVDCQWGDAADAPTPTITTNAPRLASHDAVVASAKALGHEKGSVLFIGGHALRERGLRAVERIRAATGCRVFSEMFSARVERGRHLPWFRTLPYFPERALEALEGTEALVMAGTPAPVTFFATAAMDRSELTPPGCELVTLADPHADVEGSLEALADELGAAPEPVIDERSAPAPPTGDALTPETIGQAVVALMPEHAIVIEEATTGGFGYTIKAPSGLSHTSLGLTGGAIGMGLPLALGAAVAAPDRQVIALQADGSAMYTSQALWSMAREGAKVTVVIYANREYAILRAELARAGVREPGPVATSLTDLSNPAIDFVALAQSMGVPGSRATTGDEFVAQLEHSLAGEGPSLVEAVI
jgi:acetolactate synthase-1/2/3 large subunit